MLNLGNALHSKGFSITVIHTHFNSPDPIEFPNFNFHFIEDVLSKAKTPLSGSLDTITILNKNCLESFQNCLSQILEDAFKDKEPVACLISDPLWEFAGVVADQLNLPRLALRTGGLLASVLYESLPLLQEKGYFPLQGTSWLPKKHKTSFSIYSLIKLIYQKICNQETFKKWEKAIISV